MKCARSFVLIISISVLTPGCASIVEGKRQAISIETRAEGKPIAGASCRLENRRGAWLLTTPNVAEVQRDYEDLVVRCELDGHDPGITTAKSSTKGMAFGNILFGGIIGAAVDVGSGAAYDYPSIIRVELGQKRTAQSGTRSNTSGHEALPDSPMPVTESDHEAQKVAQ